MKKPGCGCDLCLQPLPAPVFPGHEENERRLQAYYASRRKPDDSRGEPTDEPMKDGQ